MRKLRDASSLGGHLEELRGRTILLACDGQAAAALALIELDGVARRIVLCPPDLPDRYLPQVVAEAGADAWVGNADRPLPGEFDKGLCVVVKEGEWVSSEAERRQSHETEWVLLTSGTTGAPKLVLHTLVSLTSALLAGQNSAPGTVWATFYDIRRYGGLQVFLRGIHAGSLILSSQFESMADFLQRAATLKVSHISGTPSHWRKALMSDVTLSISPRYVRLSGEIADQAVLDSLRTAFPNAMVAHAFASTEAGVAFEVRDGRAGFPATLAAAGSTSLAQIDVSRGTLRVRSAGNAIRYLGPSTPPLQDDDGFVDTGDHLELRDGRYYFMGRGGGVINVGGLKVYPEEVEAVINSHPLVQMSRVAARRNAITGALVTAEIVMASGENPVDGRSAGDQLKEEIIAVCRSALAAHKVPAMIKFVPCLEVSASGKLVRANA